MHAIFELDTKLILEDLSWTDDDGQAHEMFTQSVWPDFAGAAIESWGLVEQTPTTMIVAIEAGPTEIAKLPPQRRRDDG